MISARRGALLATLIVVIGAVSGCSSQFGVPLSIPTALTSVDRAYIADLRGSSHFSVTSSNERAWIQLGHGVCTGVASKGVSKYMAETGTHQYGAMLVVAPLAIKAYCPQFAVAYASWEKARG